MKPTWLWLIYGLACYRLALLFGDDLGPYGLMAKLRSFLKREAKTNKPLRDSKVHLGISCIRCESVWYGMLIAPYAYFHDRLPAWVTATGDIFLLAFALSAAAILFHRTARPT